VNLKNFFTELKRRNVYKVAIAYAVTGWAIAEGASQIFSIFDVPNWAVRLVVLLIVVGFPLCIDFRLGIRDHAGGFKANRNG
jgi:hypothetical protein